MADNLTDEMERLVIDWLTGKAVTQPVTPLKVRLMSAVGSDSAAGTEVTGDSYVAQTVTFPVAATTGGTSKAANDTAVTFSMIDSTTSKSVAGAEIWDSGTTPRRILHGAFASAVTVPAGEPLIFSIGDLSLTLG